ncbi:MAG: hypothetical protein ACNA8W_17775 [Bradymonadaceae bacterium]
MTATSYLEIFTQLARMTITDLVIMFLISKPVFVIIALGAVISGQSEWNQRLKSDGSGALRLK